VDVTLLFWCTTILRYVLATIAAIFVSFFVAFISVAFVIAPNDDSPVLGLLWFMLAVVLAGLLVPVSLGVTGEMVERKAHGRSFRWLKALLRSLIALPIVLGPVYTAFWVTPWVESSRQPHWVVKQTILYCLSATFAYLALRIKRASPLATDLY